MAQVILSAAGQALGGPVGAAIGGFVGRTIDNAVLSGLEPARQRGPRLDALKLQSTADGAPMACVFGRARVAGQVIWAARFLEARHESGGGKGDPRVVDHAYSLSFAVAVGEGPIDGIGRVWADGHPLDLSGVTMRMHRGTAAQAPDPLIEAVEGAAPAFRGTAYVVFEDLALGPFGNRPPQLSFEVFRRPRGQEPRLEDRLEGVCLIPGAGEFVLATEGVLRREGLTRTAAENLTNGEGRPDLLVSLDQLEAQCPNLRRVSLVVGWFGDDLRAGQCAIRPGVERRDKATTPLAWSVAGFGRHDAHLISRVGRGPAYGGTPSDATVRQAVAALKARGWVVTLYPFVFMDIAPGNGLPDPHGGAEQPAYPWRGRIRAEDGAAATGQAAAFFDGAEGLGRMVRHYAGLAVETGADGLLIGSELRDLTRARDADGGYPAVARLRALAAECRGIVGPAVALSYAADWSEYFGDRAGGEVMFHLDPLWADPAIDYVGIDWYPPLSDWRDGADHLDARAGFAGPRDPAYLAAQVAGGDGFDWFYADAADRAAQIRTPIADTAHGEDWVFRPKDLVGWWSNSHHDRPGGVRSATPTAWTPGMKPIRLTELGCAAVDRGANAPNLFQDPKSAESDLPPFSTGARDDAMQRRALEAVLGHFDTAGANPVSPVYGAPMLAAADVWCWDARPYPAFPARTDLWADAGAWASGHWLNGRLAGAASDLISAMLIRGGLDPASFTVAGVEGDIAGYVIGRPMRTRDALEPLLAALGVVAAERGGRVAVLGETTGPLALTSERLALAETGTAVRAARRLESPPSLVQVRHIDEGSDYQAASVVARSGPGGSRVDLDLPAVCGAGLARALATRVIATAAAVEQVTVLLGPLDALRLECGDRVALDGRDGIWRVDRLILDETPSAVLSPVVTVPVEVETVDWRPRPAGVPIGAPFVALLDLPPLPGREGDVRPLVAVAIEPWRPMRVHAGPTVEALTARAEVRVPARVGTLSGAVGPGPRHRWDKGRSLIVRVEGAAPQSLAEARVLGGENAVAVRSGTGGWEIIQFQWAELIGDNAWRLRGLLRGQQGTDGEMAAGLADGAQVVFLDPDLPRLEMAMGERGLPLISRAGPAGAPPGEAGFTQTPLVWAGVHDRPWSPAHLRARRLGGDVVLDWIARARLDGDRWDGDVVASAPERFRVRVHLTDWTARTFDVDGHAATYTAAAQAEDFPAGLPVGLAVAVAQQGPGFGWGTEARVAIA